MHSTQLVKEPMPSWGLFALIIQIVLVFFAPPLLSENLLGLGPRHIFISDLWCIFWVLISVFSQARHFLRFFLISTGILTVIYVHGYFRIPASGILKETIVYNGKPDLFNALAEFIVYARFLSWLWAGQLVYSWFTSEIGLSHKQKILRTLQWVLAICLILASISLIMTSLDPAIKEWFGSLYHYNFRYYSWRDRQYGIFSSPIEASATLLFGAVLLCVRPLIPFALLVPTLLVTLLGAILTHSVTPFISLLFVTAFILNQKLKNKWKWFAPILGILSVLFLFYLFRNQNDIHGKIDDLTFRMGGWSSYLKMALMRWDLLFLGFGFTIYYTDSSYLFLIHKGGLLLVGSFFYFIYFMHKKYWNLWTMGQKCIPIFILITGIALDFFIFRHAVTLLITIGVPLLLAIPPNPNRL